MKFGKIAAVTAAAGVLALVASQPAQASYIVNIDQDGSNVVATGSGTIDLTGLTFSESGPPDIGIIPSDGELATGTPGNSDDLYTGFTGPASFGSGFVTLASNGSGDVVGIFVGDALLGVPEGYVSGSSLSSGATWDNQTFASLGLTPGSYLWAWNSTNAPDDSFAVNIGVSPVPEPSSLALLGAALVGLIGLGRYRRQAHA